MYLGRLVSSQGIREESRFGLEADLPLASIRPHHPLVTASSGVERTISNDPRMTPQRTLLNHNPPAFASLGNSANSANGFSSRESINSLGAGRVVEALFGGKEIAGEMLRKVLKATWG